MGKKHSLNFPLAISPEQGSQHSNFFFSFERDFIKTFNFLLCHGTRTKRLFHRAEITCNAVLNAMYTSICGDCNAIIVYTNPM